MPRSATLLIIAAFLLASTTVHAVRIVRFIFNAGDSACNDADNLKLDPIFHPIVRRQLRASAISKIQFDPLSRGLSTQSQTCKEACATQASMCRSWFCLYGGGRRAQELEPESVERELQANLTCNQQINLVHSELNKLISTNAVSPSCLAAISIPNRRFSCFDDVIFGSINNVVLWNLTNPASPATLTSNMKSNTVSICSSMPFSIEAITNSCVDQVHFELLGPGGFNKTDFEMNEPFALFGNVGLTLKGKRLSTIGNYTLSMIPDFNQTKARIINFRVKQC